MKFHAVVQNEAEWLFLRCGKPTASAFDQIITPKNAELSKSSGGYLNAILAELIVGHPIQYEETQWMTQGHEREDEAIAAYEFLTDRETAPGGFVTTDDELIGASPDRLIGNDRLLEIKNPKKAGEHVGFMLDGGLDDKHRPQLQGQLWVCEREYVDVVSYYPELPPAVITVKRDEEYIAKLSNAVRGFTLTLHARIEKLIERGLIKKNWRELMVPPKPEAYDGPDFISEEDVRAIFESQAKENS